MVTYLWGKPQLPASLKREECGGGKCPSKISYHKIPAREPRNWRKATILESEKKAALGADESGSPLSVVIA